MARPLGPRGPLTRSVLVKLTEAQLESLRAAALVNDCTAPEFVRQALDDRLHRSRLQVGTVVAAVRRVRKARSRSR